MAGPNDLYDLCAEWLSLIDEALVATDGGGIARSYVSAPGLPPAAVDMCEQVIVSGAWDMAATEPNNPTLNPGFHTQFGGVLLVPLTAIVVRCVPDFQDNSGNPPTLAQMDEAAIVTHADLWSIVNYTFWRHQQGLLFPPKDRELFFDGGTAVPSAGGFGGWRISIRVQLPGFKPPST